MITETYVLVCKDDDDKIVHIVAISQLKAELDKACVALNKAKLTDSNRFGEVTSYYYEVEFSYQFPREIQVLNSIN